MLTTNKTCSNCNILGYQQLWEEGIVWLWILHFCTGFFVSYLGMQLVLTGVPCKPTHCNKFAVCCQLCKPFCIAMYHYCTHWLDSSWQPLTCPEFLKFLPSIGLQWRWQLQKKYWACFSGAPPREHDGSVIKSVYMMCAELLSFCCEEQCSIN